MARRVILPALLVLAFAAACERSPSPAPPQPPSSEAPRGAGVPFEVGDAPDIRELEKVDLATFVAGEPWCTKGEGGRRVHFAQGGDFVKRARGEEAHGTWQVTEGRLEVATAGEEKRALDARAASVNGRDVLLLDGLLYGRCGEQK